MHLYNILSVRVVNIVMSVSLILVSGFVCGFLSFDAGERAYNKALDDCSSGLADTRRVGEDGMAAFLAMGDDGLNSCFTSGEDNARYLGEQMMNKIGDMMSAQFTGFLDPVVSTVEIARNFIAEFTPQQISDREFITNVVDPVMFNVFRTAAPKGVTDFFIISSNRPGLMDAFMRLYTESPYTQGAPPEAFHLYEKGMELDKECRHYMRHVNHNGENPDNLDVYGQARCEAVPPMKTAYTTNCANPPCYHPTCMWCAKVGASMGKNEQVSRSDGVCMPVSDLTSESATNRCPDGFEPPTWYADLDLAPPRALHGYVDNLGRYIDDVPNATAAEMAALTQEDREYMNGKWKYSLGTEGSPVVMNAPPMETSAGFVTRAMVDREFKNQVRWAPLGDMALGPSLGLKAYTSWDRHDLPDLVETRGQIVGIIYGSIDVLSMSHFFRQIELPPDSRMYAVQVNPFFNPVSLCRDDMNGMLQLGGMKCNGITAALGCETDLAVLSTQVRKGTWLHELCPVSCGTCPAVPPVGILVGATHGDVATKQPLETSYFGTNENGETEWVTAAGVTMRGLADVRPLHVTNATDPVIRANGRYVMARERNFIEFDPAQMFEWTYVDEGGASRLYWMKVRTTTDDRGLLLYITLVIPEDEIMAVIDAATEATKTSIRQTRMETNARVAQENQAVKDDVDANNKKTEEARKEDMDRLLIIIIVVIIAMLIVSVIFVHFIVAPLKKLEAEMAEAAMMHLDFVDMDKKHMSHLGEVHRMQKSFHRMIKNLKEFKQFMPASLLVDDNDEEEAAAEEEWQMSKRDTMHSRDSRSRRTKGQAQTVASSMASSQSVQMRAFLQKTMGEGIKKKRVSFATVNVRGWHDATKKMDDRQTTSFHTKMLEGVINASSISKSIPDSFSGDRALFSMNAVKPMATHRVAAVHTLFNIREFFSKAAGEVNTLGSVTASAPPCESLSASGAASTGDARVGNMGCTGMKKFTFLTTNLTFVYALERLNRMLDTHALIDSTIAEAVEGAFYLRIADRIAFPKHMKKDMVVKDVCSKSAASEDEWMYQLEEGAKKDPNRQWNEAATAIVAEVADAGAFEKASEAFASQEIAASAPAPVLARFRGATAEGAFTTRELCYH